ncbi:MAG: LysR family transcriptional regulator [Myxococcota bacterium]
MHESTAQLNWDDLRVFSVVVAKGSFSATARVLGVEPSTVGRRIKRLEDALGVVLFERAADGLRVTDAAAPLVAHAEATARSIEALFDAARGVTSSGGRVRVACTRAMAELILLPRMSAFMAEHPSIRLDLDTGLDFVDLGRGDADIALRSQRPSEHGLVARKLTSLTFGAFASADYASGHRTQAPTSWDWLVVRANVVESRYFDEHVGTEPRLTTASFKEQLDAVQAGLGVGLIARRVAEMLDLVELPMPGLPVPPPFDLWMVTQRERGQQPHVRAVIDWLVSLVRGTP